MIIVKKNNVSLILIIWIFLLLYYPPILNVNMLHIVAVISYLYLIKNYKYFLKIGGFNKAAKEMLLLLAISIYMIIICTAGEGSVLGFVGFMELLIEVIPSSFAIAIYMKKRNYTKEDYIVILLMVGTIQGIISLISFLVPDFQSIIIHRAIIYGFDSEKYSSFLNRRYFGVAYNLVTYVTVVQSFFSVLTMRYFINKRKKYILMTPFLLFSAIVNGRSSIIIIIIGIFLLICEEVKKANGESLIKIICMTLFFLFLLIIGIKKIEFISPRTFIWLTDGIKEIFLFFTKLDMQGSYFSTLLNWNKFIPEGINLFFGVGELSIGGNTFGVSSDIGYINYLWFGGAILFVLLHWFYIDIIYQIHKTSNKTIRFSAVFFLLICFIYNIKMPVFLLNECSIMIIMMYVVTIIL